MTVMVLGGAGYIGSHAVKQLLKRGYEVAVIDNLQTGHRKAVPEEAYFFEGDIRNRAFLKSVFAQMQTEGVLHFAANSLVGESMEEPLKYFDNNVYGTQAVLEIMKEFDVKHIVFSSSAAVYGEAAHLPITEDTMTKPESTYGESKLMMEKMMHWCSKAYGLRYVSLRYFNVAGAALDGSIGEDHYPETHLVPIILQTALGKRDKLSIYGTDYATKDGTCVRDYVHVVDLIEAHILALEYLKQGGKSEIFNLGSSKGFTVKEMIEAAHRVTGETIPAVIGSRRPGDPTALVASSDKAREVLGWRPRYTEVEKMLATAWQWHRSNPEGYQDR